MAAELRLALPWAPWLPERVGDLLVRRGPEHVLSYDDGITLDVLVLDPASYSSADALLQQADDLAEPGRVVLVAGAVPTSWRELLREGDLSFIDVSGAVDIDWPRLRATATHFAHPATQQPAMTLQPGHAIILEELLITGAGGARPTISKLASGAGVSLPAASRAISQLCERGLAVKERADGKVIITLADRAAAAGLLAAQTAWPGDDVAGGYLEGADAPDLASAVSGHAAGAGIELAVTGRAGAAWLGVPGTSPPPAVRCWVVPGAQGLPEMARQLGLAPAPDGQANIMIAADLWRVGVHRRSRAEAGGRAASVAHPVRVWCDLHTEPGGTALAAELWALAYGPRSQSRR